jgi:hypothetical protein
MEWIYFADGNQALIRVPATGDADLKARPGQRYWGKGSLVGPQRLLRQLDRRAARPLPASECR